MKMLPSEKQALVQHRQEHPCLHRFIPSIIAFESVYQGHYSLNRALALQNVALGLL